MLCSVYWLYCLVGSIYFMNSQYRLINIKIGKNVTLKPFFFGRYLSVNITVNISCWLVFISQYNTIVMVNGWYLSLIVGVFTVQPATPHISQSPYCCPPVRLSWEGKEFAASFEDILHDGKDEIKWNENI